MKTNLLLSGIAACCLFAAGCGDADRTAGSGTPPPEERAAAAPDLATLLDQAIAGEHRSEGNRARDRFRNPKETLTFFGLQPQMTVIELYPGSGWYTEVLAPVLRERGTLIAAQFDPAFPPSYRARVVTSFRARLESEPAFANVRMIIIPEAPETSLGEDGTADMVLTFRNLHTWTNAGELETMFAAVGRVLKPGGVFGVVQHRANEGVDPVESAQTGYLPESFVIEKAREAGLELDARSDINANPADTKNYTVGVWALPPSLRGDLDMRAEREAIGESDRMTLRFVKR
ncbi:MAG: class I SAM-dependent methyltransferase [Gammaproteobacteria bacterium]